MAKKVENKEEKKEEVVTTNVVTENTVEEVKKVENKEENEVEEIKKQEKEAISTAEKLKKDMVEIKIPIDQNNPKELVVDVFINGYRWSIERGKTVSVPREVRNILENAKYI